MDASKNLPVLVRPEGRGFRAECLLLADCHIFAVTRDGALSQIRDAIAFRLERDKRARERLPSSYEIIYVPVGDDVLPSSRGRG